MTSSNEVPNTLAEHDYNALLRDNLERVFNERDATRRAAAIGELYSTEPTLYEPAGIVKGAAAIADVAGTLLAQFGPDFAFLADGPAAGHHGLGYLRWRAGPADGSVVVSGVDVAEVSDGKIVRLWVLLDAPQG